MATTRTLSFPKARALASSLRLHPHYGRGWSFTVDRDLAREVDELMAMSQSQMRTR